MATDEEIQRLDGETYFVDEHHAWKAGIAAGLLMQLPAWVTSSIVHDDEGNVTDKIVLVLDDSFESVEITIQVLP